MRQPARQDGFTLIELLVVIAIIALLVSVLLPSLHRAKTLAKIITAHAELRNITIAMDLYREENDQAIPPTRASCSSRSAYDLPMELLGYLPGGRNGTFDTIAMPDPFTPETTYRYRAIGAMILNESTITENTATLWVPTDFPNDDATTTTGRYCSDPDTSPVRYAVWSMGPDPAAALFDIPGRLPLPKRYWLGDAASDGVIVHYEDADRQVHLSP